MCSWKKNFFLLIIIYVDHSQSVLQTITHIKGPVSLNYPGSQKHRATRNAGFLLIKAEAEVIIALESSLRNLTGFPTNVAN